MAKIALFVLVSVTFFYLGKHWSDNIQQLVFFSPHQTSSVSLSPNNDASFNISSIVAEVGVPPPADPPPPPPPAEQTPPQPPITKFGIVDQNGTMANEFEVGEFDPDEVVENWSGNGTDQADTGESGSGRVRVERFKLCPGGMSEYIPCLDNEEAIRRLKSTDKGERFERHCPETGSGLGCLVPPPKKYRTPIPWPKSRDEVTIYFFWALFSTY